MVGPQARSPENVGSIPKGLELSGTEVAEYISPMLEGLRLAAVQAQLSFLAYLIDVALQEANSEKLKS